MSIDFADHALACYRLKASRVFDLDPTLIRARDDRLTSFDANVPAHASQFQHVFCTPLKTAWAEWTAWEHEFQGANLEKVRQNPLTPFKDLSPRPLGWVSRAFVDPQAGSMYLGFNAPGVVSVGLL